MAEKKSKVAKKNIKQAAITKTKKEPEAIVAQNVETLFPASQIAGILNIPSFDYFIMAKKYGFNDGVLFTVAQFKEMYQKAMKEGR